MPLVQQKSIAKESFLFFLFCLCFLLYFPSLKGGFILDDWYVIVQNPLVKQPALYPQILTHGFFSAYDASSEFTLGYYRPVTLFSFALDYQIWGLNPFGYRLVNILIHFLNGILVYHFVGLISKNKKVAFLSSILFCILPTQEWVINHVVGRGDLLQVFFSLLSLICFTDYIGNRKKNIYAFSILFFILSLLSREVAVVDLLLFPFVCLYCTRDFKEIRRVSLPILSVGLVYILLRFLFFPAIKIGAFGQLLKGDLFSQLTGLGSYLLRFMFPWSVRTLFNQTSVISLIDGVLILLGFLFIFIFIFKKPRLEARKEFIFGGMWIFINLLPLFLLARIITRLGPYLSESLFYFLSIGFTIALSCVFLNCQKTFRYFALGVLAFFYAACLFSNNLFWGSEKEILARVYRTEKTQRYVSGMQLLMKYENNKEATQKMLAQASDSFSKSIWTRKLGSIARKEKKYDEAVKHFQEAIGLVPTNLEAYNELAVTFLEVGDQDLAVRWLRAALNINPQSAETQRLLGMVFYHQEKYSLAADYLQRASFYDPDNREALRYLAMAYFFNQQEGQYRDVIERIFHRPAQTKDTLKFIANELYRKGYFSNVLRLIEGFKKIGGDDPEMMRLLVSARFYLEERNKRRAYSSRND